MNGGERPFQPTLFYCFYWTEHSAVKRKERDGEKGEVQCGFELVTCHVEPRKSGLYEEENTVYAFISGLLSNMHHKYCLRSVLHSF